MLLNLYIQHVILVIYVCKAVPFKEEVVWKYVSTMSGELFVMILGVPQILVLLADSWDSQNLVYK